MTTVVDVVLAVCGVPVLLCCAYLGVLTLLSGRRPAPSSAGLRSRFRVLIPAHNESAGIAPTIAGLLALDYPKELFDVVVIADNCSDDTAERARAAGADVLERRSETERGKGYALHYAFERLPETVDAAVVIDADTLPSPNLLRAFAARLEAGATAVQADYAVRNPGAAWRTRLMAIALGAFHIVRSRGRERLGVSAGLRGNGMCFSARALREVPHHAYSIVEDVEYGIRLAEAGHRVFYADEAHVYGEMVTSAKAARSQRERWESGRAALKQKYGLPLLRRGLGGDLLLFDLGMDVLVPPLSRLAVASVGGVLLCAVLAFFVAPMPIAAGVYGTSAALLVFYVLRGWMLSGTGARGLLDLLLAPAYVVWKIAAVRKTPARPDAEWVRTTREGR